MPAGCAQDLLAGEHRPAGAERHTVLQLVAETIGARNLIETGPAPHAAAKRLIQEPAISQEIHRWIGRLDLNGAQGFVPEIRDGAQHLVHVCGLIAVDQCLDMFFIAPLAQKNDNLRLLPGRQRDDALQHRAGIHPGTQPARQGRIVD